MRINGINTNCRFGMQMTGEVEEGFRKSQLEVKDFWGENSEKYKDFCYHLNMVRTRSENYVVGVGHDAYNSYYPYYFKMRSKSDDDKHCYRAGGLATSTKEELFSFDSLKNLALTAYFTEQRDRKNLEEALKPEKESFLGRLKKLFSKKQ